ncbi:unnamed protein product [Brachionus calyciflorus]|uniref:Trs120/TRAPPC9 N-terminal domain-containing protein n=1 Tax=Brachionus calyciflorus TaxID=104777 RepID=A0A813ZPB7_9BILA|nr:unnamed protein product [Brachionus calyciflorus]
MNIDFDYKITDPNKILFLVKDLLEKDHFTLKSNSCDCFNDYECHHLPNHHLNESIDLNQNRIGSKCSYCQFFDLLSENYTSFRINIENSNKNSQKQNVYLRYKKRYYTTDVIDWFEFQPWKCPFGLIGYASCKTLNDVKTAVEKFEHEKLKYNKSLVVSKIIIDFHMQHEMSEEFQKTIKINHLNKQPVLDSFSYPSLEMDSVSILDASSLLHTSSFENVSNFLTDNISLVHSDGNLNPNLNSPQLQNPESPEQNLNFDRSEVNALLRPYENDLVYLDFLFAQGSDRISALLDSERSNILRHLEDCVNQIFKKFYNLVKSLNPNDDNKLNFYSEYLKAPFEITTDSNMNSSLSIRLINKSLVKGRMNKHKGDYYMMMNFIDNATLHYLNAQKYAKEENDFIWLSSVLEGLCAASYIYSDKKSLDVNSNSLENYATQNDENVEAKISKSKTIKSMFKNLVNNDPDVAKNRIKISDFMKNYQQIMSYYHNTQATKIMSLEVSLMITKFFLEKNLPFEVLEFIKNAIYISNVSISEEEKIRRYLEIALIYEKMNMNHSASFYKSISIGRIFRITENNPMIIENSYFKCLLKKCIDMLVSLFDDMKIISQAIYNCKDLIKTKNKYSGFPDAKKRVIIHLIQFYQYFGNSFESLKYVKYLIHELCDTLTDGEIEAYMERFMTLMEKNMNLEQMKNDPFYTKFYKFPLLNSLSPIVFKSCYNTSSPIKSDQTSKSIYIVRQQTAFESMRKPKIFTFPIDNLNKIEFKFTNILPIQMKIKSIDLIAESKTNNDNNPKEQFLISLVKFDEPTQREIILEPKSNSVKINLGFVFNNLGNYLIIGYELTTFNNKETIYFSEIIFKKKNKYSNTTSSIEKSYQFDMVPKIPIIKQIRLIRQNFSNQVFHVDQTKNLIVESFLGNKVNFLVDLIQEYEAEEMEILKYRFNILNDQQAQRLNCKIDFTKTDNFYLSIDSTEFKFDSIFKDLELNKDQEQTANKELELKNFLEIKYTNNTGLENNLCNNFKVQTLIKFTQPIYAKLININDVNENEFEVVVFIENLLKNDSIKVHLGNSKEEIIESLSSLEIRKTINKFELFSLLSYEDFNKTSIDNLNKFLNIHFSIDSDPSKFKILFSHSVTNLMSYLDKIYKFPFKLVTELSKEIKSQFISYSIMMIVFNNTEFKHLNNKYNFKAKIIDKIGNFYISKNFSWRLRDLSMDYWCKEMRLMFKNNLTNEPDELSLENKNFFLIKFYLKDEKSSNLIKWTFRFDTTNKFSYIFS